MLTADQIEDTLFNDLDGDNSYSIVVKTSKVIHSQHIAECERLMELAFNAAKEKRYESDFPYGLEKFKTFKDYKDSLSDASNR